MKIVSLLPSATEIVYELGLGDSLAAVTFECANRHRATEPLPDDAKLRRFIQNWVARKGAQLEEQHKRWEAERDGQ